MDNRKIDLHLEGKEDFELAMKLAMDVTMTEGYRIDKGMLILYKADSDRAIKLPYKMGVHETINFVWGWLQQNPPQEKEPDHDGHNGRGFRIFNESWGQVGGEWQAFIAIKPIWAMYGK